MTHILVVEDDESIRLLLEALLTHEGYQVQAVRHGQAALEAIQQDPPDLILLDLAMPVMDGRTYLVNYRGQAARRSPVIVVSSQEDARHDQELLRRIDDFLAKPFRVADLLDCVKRHIATRVSH
jgi:CheY-like chemotaxis protein